MLVNKSISARTLTKCPKDLSREHLLAAASNRSGVSRQLAIAKGIL